MKEFNGQYDLSKPFDVQDFLKFVMEQSKNARIENIVYGEAQWSRCAVGRYLRRKMGITLAEFERIYNKGRPGFDQIVWHTQSIAKSNKELYLLLSNSDTAPKSFGTLQNYIRKNNLQDAS